jgi:hypothetical protein
VLQIRNLRIADTDAAQVLRVQEHIISGAMIESLSQHEDRQSQPRVLEPEMPLRDFRKDGERLVGELWSVCRSCKDMNGIEQAEVTKEQRDKLIVQAENDRCR